MSLFYGDFDLSIDVAISYWFQWSGDVDWSHFLVLFIGASFESLFHMSLQSQGSVTSLSVWYYGSYFSCSFGGDPFPFLFLPILLSMSLISDPISVYSSSVIAF